MEPKSELVRRSMKIVKNRAGSTINDRADSLLIHENTALNERSYSRKGLLNGSLVESEGMHMEERRSGNVAADSYAHLVETPYGGKAVAFDDNDDQSFISDRSREKSVDNILGSDSPDSSRRASEAGEGDDLRVSQRLNSYVQLDHSKVAEGSNSQHVHVKTPLGSKARLVRHTFTSLQDTADLLSPEKVNNQ